MLNSPPRPPLLTSLVLLSVATARALKNAASHWLVANSFKAASEESQASTYIN